MAHDRRAGAAQDPRLGPALLVDRGRHAHQHEVGRLERLDAVGQREAAVLQVAAQLRLSRLQQLGLAGADLLQARAEMSIPMIRAPAARSAIAVGSPT